MSIFGALNSSVTGLQAQSDALGVISDNISNVNTTGYKANQANFAQLVTSAPTDTSYNPGGVQFRPTQEIGKQGILNSSDISTDLGIDGNGFFAVKDAVGDVEANPLEYTRTGNFRVNDEGNLENKNGLLLQGWQLSEDANGNLTPPADQSNPGSLQTVNVKGFSGIARATQNIDVGANLPPNLSVGESRSTTVRIFDAEGTSHNVKLEFSRDSGDGTTPLGNNQYRVDVNAPRLSEATGNPQSGLFELGTAIDATTAPGSGGIDINGNSLSNAIVAGNQDGPPANVDLDGDGTAEAAETFYQVGNTRIRAVDSDGAAGPPPPAIDENSADLVEIDEDNNGSQPFEPTLRLFSSNGGGDTTFERASRLSTVVQFNGDGSIEQIGTDALNGSLNGTVNGSGPGNVNNLAIGTDANGELSLNVDFADTPATQGGTAASEPQQVSLNIGTPRDIDANGDGTLQPQEQDVNEKQLDGLTSFENPEGFQINELAQDGLQFGNFTGVDVGEDGIVTANFSNGERREIFQLPVATFNNPNGLEATGQTAFRESRDSGEVLLNEAGLGGAGTFAPGSLEDSTVELSTEFTNMIETQRAYSASTRVVTTSDEMLQEIVNATR